MNQGILSKERLQPCPDCGITICSCKNCHTIHCDSETLCTYLKSIQKMSIQKPIDPTASASILDNYTTNITVYTSKINEKYDIVDVISLDNDTV